VAKQQVWPSERCTELIRPVFSGTNLVKSAFSVAS